MPYGVVFHLDPATTAAVHETWQALADAGVEGSLAGSGQHPHVTLALSDTVDLPALQDATAQFAASLAPFRLTLSSVGAFATGEGVVFFGVTVTHALLDAHAEYHRVFSRHARQPYAYYRVGAWVPHCTLAANLDREQVSAAVDIARRAPLPLYGSVHELCIVRVEPDRAEALGLFQLGRAA